ncbi:hypothetical protein [Synechococcus sp. BA-132 BA5]|uniref:hypothetical protein n=1 Tax=Synechococcus sp. BA-132 BA5 TaxID=3110252 RepID=UPI002B220AA2|nr:hypothetical protein [Synechococcus sp. BA-132 BA5]MEA5415316.1 hypothetical protein [Synechococcus sp. BA-132 BA5]
MLSVVAVSQQQQQQQRSQPEALVQRADSNLQGMRQVVATAAGTTELHAKLVALNGPVLNDADRTLPLPVINAQVMQRLNQANAQLERKQQPLPPSNPWRLIPEILRNAFAGFVLAVGFAGLARRPGVEASLLVELQNNWQAFRWRRSKGRGRPSQIQADLDSLGHINSLDADTKT